MSVGPPCLFLPLSPPPPLSPCSPGWSWSWSRTGGSPRRAVPPSAWGCSRRFSSTPSCQGCSFVFRVDARADIDRHGGQTTPTAVEVTRRSRSQVTTSKVVRQGVCHYGGMSRPSRPRRGQRHADGSASCVRDQQLGIIVLL